MQGNSGQLNYSYPLTVAPGPKGTAPSLALAYSSAASNGRTSPRSPAENTGEGWALTMGSISEAKEAGGSIWYFINGVDNVSDRLIPDSTTIQTGTNFATEHLSYLKVSMVDAGFDSQHCFHVWDTSGNYYEFGCTTNSLQYYTDSSGNRTNYRYDLDQFIPANEGPGSATRLLNASYLADSETDSGGHTSITDAVLKQITYGTSTSADISNHKTTTVSGTIDFFYKGANSNMDSNGVQWVTAYGNNEGGCVLPSDYKNPTDGTNTTNERCDDPRGKTSGLDDPHYSNLRQAKTWRRLYVLQAKLHDDQGHTIDAEQARKVVQSIDDAIRIMEIQIRTRQDGGYLPFADTLPPVQEDEGDE